MFSGSYTDLSNKPTIPAAQVSSDWTAVSGITSILNKPTLFSGSYTDLSNKPTIPAAQVSSDWSAVSGITSILNKPTIPTGSKWTAGATATNIYYSDGNVGIGTSATSDADDNVNLAIPTATLFVKGGASAAGTCDVVIRGGVAGGDNGKARLWLAADASHSSYIQSQHTGSGNTQLTFGTSIGNALPAERMIIGTDGCLYINNTNYENASATSGFKLLVSGSDSNGVCAKFFHPNRTQGLGIQYDGLSGLSANQNIIMRPSGTGKFQVEGNTTISGNVGIGNTAPAVLLHVGSSTLSADIAATGNITAYYSDERLKTKISNINEPLKIINNLNGFYYVPNELAHKNGIIHTNKEIGLSAQDVQKVLPEIINIAPFDLARDKDGNKVSKSGDNYLTISYDRLAPVFVEAIKELNQKNISLTNENIELKEKYNKLLEDIKSQEDRIKELEANMAHILNYISK